MATDHYTYRVTWSPEDRENVGLCVEFPSLSWLASTPDDAFRGYPSARGRCRHRCAGHCRATSRFVRLNQPYSARFPARASRKPLANVRSAIVVSHVRAPLDHHRRPEQAARSVRRGDRAQGGPRCLPGSRVPAGGVAQCDQPGSETWRPALHAHDQRLPGMQPCLHLLLRPAQPRLPRTRHRRGFRHQDRREDQRSRGGSPRDRAGTLGGAPDRHGNQHRPLPAG